MCITESPCCALETLLSQLNVNKNIYIKQKTRSLYGLMLMEQIFFSKTLHNLKKITNYYAEHLKLM